MEFYGPYDEFKSLNGAKRLDVPYTTRIRELYKPYVSDVKVLNMYIKGRSVRTTFLCDMVNATSSCALSKQRTPAPMVCV